MNSTLFITKIGHIAHMGITSINRKASIKEAIDVMLQSNLRDVIFEVDSGHRIFTVSDLLDHLKNSDDFSVAMDTLPQHNLTKVCEN